MDTIIIIVKHTVIDDIVIVGDTIFLATGHGVSISTDNGENWKEVNTGLLNPLYVFSLTVNSSGDIFAGTYNGIFRSIDNGENWMRVGLENNYRLTVCY